MPRFPVTILVLSLMLSLCACATRSRVGDLSERVALLELELGMTHASDGLNRENIQDLDQRLTFLENEARSRGVAVPYRVDQDFAPVSPDTPTQSPAPAPAQAQRQAPPVATSPSLPASPVSSLSPQVQEPQQPDSLLAPVGAPEPAEPTSEPVVGPVIGPDPAPVAQPAASVTPAANSSSSQLAYDAALQMYRTGRFAEADAAFAAFLITYPDSRLVPNALYWRGESFYARGMYVDAIFAFKDVQTRFPDHQKTPDSLLKTAMAYKRLGDAGNTRLHLSALFEDWPNSEAAKRAQSMGLLP